MWRKGTSVALTAGAISAVTALALASPSDASGGGQKIKMRDDCQPATFNLAIGPGTCIGDGNTSVNAFFAGAAAAPGEEGGSATATPPSPAVAAAV